MKTLKKFNGRGHGTYNKGAIYVAAYNKAHTLPSSKNKFFHKWFRLG